MEDPVADSSADDTEESTAASEMTTSPKETVTQPDGTPTSNSQAEGGCKCLKHYLFIAFLLTHLPIFYASCV